MSFWSWLTNPNHNGETSNSNVPPPAPGTVGPTGYRPGDAQGVTFEGEVPETRSLPAIYPSPWSGWPAEWSTPAWDFGSRFNELVDVAWACLDLNASVLSTMPVYRTQGGRIVPPATWMTNPEPSIYTSWHEFAKQLFWDYMLGEAFVLPVALFADGFAMTFRVIPPWMINVEMKGGIRRYRLGGASGPDVSDEILHIRYKSTTDGAHGVGPLEAAGGRMLTAGVLAQYVRTVAETGGVPNYTLESDAVLDNVQAQDLLNRYMQSRMSNLGAPPVLSSGLSLQTHMSMSPKEMAMLEIAQFTESRIAVALGVPPHLVGLPQGGDLVYQNVSALFDFHDRSSLRPKAAHVMAALSDWALPGPQKAELNRDEYSRPSFNERAESWVALVGAGIVSVDEVRAAERLLGDAPAMPTVPATVALTGGET